MKKIFIKLRKPAYYNKYQFTMVLPLKIEKLSICRKNTFQKSINLYNVFLKMVYTH